MLKSSAQGSQKFKFKKNVEIGALAAEDDKRFLEAAFVDKSEFESLCSLENKKSIILGRTGSGKSALLQKIENEMEYVRRLQPEALSFKYLSNSNLLTFFKTQGIKLDLFYKLLWKHIFIVEILKLHFSDDKNLRTNWLTSLFQSQTKKNTRRKAIDYLNGFKDNFWEKTEHHIKEIENKVRIELEAKTGIKLQDIISASVGEKEEAETKIKSEYIQKAQEVVNEIQIEALFEVLEILKEDLLEKSGKDHFIIIDDLDKEWVDESIVYELIRSLIYVIGELNSFPHVKIIISLRENLFQLILKDKSHRGMQREKFESLLVKLRWGNEELQTLVDKRLAELIRGHYHRKPPSITELVPKGRKNSQSGFEYILERTFMRPRDVIDFVNKCIDLSDGKSDINFTTIREAEVAYSKGRLQAIEDEWLENYGDFRCFYPILFANNSPFMISDITEENLTFYLLEKPPASNHQTLYKIYSDFEASNNFDTLRKKIVMILYDVGLVGLKNSTAMRARYSYENGDYLAADELNLTCKVYLHPAFNAFFNKVADGQMPVV